jgi:hypothetical protein
MPRTTLDIDGSILREIRALHQKEGRTMGKIVSELLAEALAQRKRPGEEVSLTWVSRPMRAMVDLADKEALYAVMDRDEP